MGSMDTLCEFYTWNTTDNFLFLDGTEHVAEWRADVVTCAACKGPVWYLCDGSEAARVVIRKISMGICFTIEETETCFVTKKTNA